MADFIEKNIDTFKKIVELYEHEVKDVLDHEAKELEKRIRKIIDKHAKNYDLETQNDVNPVKYYDLKYRIKGASSLSEKLVRKNDGFKIVEICKINMPDDVQTQRSLIVPQLKRMPDIIGVRIVTELRIDCNKILSLLRAFVDDLDEDEVVFDKIDLEAQPQKMKNGLFIYKIKGIFRSAFGFELQIKSKIEEAWGDMDHAIFYKDYSVTPIKNVTHVTMNNIGKLLDNIDELLLGLRNSDNEYQENLEQIANLKELNDELFPLIVEKLGISFEIEKVASFLNSAKAKALENVQKPMTLSNLDCACLDYTVTDTRLKLYKTIRDKSFELIVIEIAYFNWCSQSRRPPLTQENYDEYLASFLDLLSSHIFSVIERENYAQAGELIEPTSLNQKITLYSKYIQSHDLFLSEKILIDIITIEAIIEEFFQEKQEVYFIDENDYSEFKTAFKVLYTVKSLGYEDTQAMSDLLLIFQVKEEIINQTLDLIAYDFKEYLRKSERNTRADLRTGETIKESILTIRTSESVVNNLKSQSNAK